ncbi:MAG: fumarate hydratase [Spirochaetes bacterium]|uniref:Fumarate hydratase n=1 Tax=Candidatus Ornithospirochaeta stercoripullorum TaxID=2840899 RepID=A0A9D9DZL7_9SPIO|nr:fumarate hydratase [Candidatus Ornithospirochaeta stercoripullorum]
MELDKAISRVAEAIIEAERKLPVDVCESIINCHVDGGKAESVMNAIKQNLEIASKTGLPMCQDTGVFWCLVSIGRESSVDLATVEHVVIEGCRKAAEDGYLRRSVVADPYSGRKNTGTNLPPFIYYELTDGSSVELSFLLKGFGSENCSGVCMLRPTDGADGIVNAVVEMMKRAGGKPCPPVFLGVGVGGTMDRAAFLSKKAFFRENMDRELSERILAAVNKLEIGPGGLGGEPTALSVSLLSEPTHIAGLPVALTVSCWAERKAVIRFEEGEL